MEENSSSSSYSDDSYESLHNFIYFPTGLDNKIEIYTRPYNLLYNLHKDGEYGFILYKSDTGECSIVGFDDDDQIIDIPNNMKCKVKYLGLPINKFAEEFRRLHNSY